MPVDHRDKPWWRCDDGEAHGSLWKLMKELEGYERRRRDEDAYHMALYGDRGALTYAAGGRVMERLGARKDRLSFNLVKAVADAAQATIAAQHTRARVLTQRGDWSLQRKAKLMEMAIEGEYDRNDVHQQAHDGFLDAAKTGTTGFKIYAKGGRPCIELVRPGEIIVDPVDGQYRQPRALYQVCFLDREVVRGLYAGSKEAQTAVRKAPKADPKRLFPWLPYDTSLDQVQVVEAWRPPDPDDWHDPGKGRHVIAIEGATLVDEKWDRGFPLAFWRYDHESSGFWGRGIAANLRPLQRELNYVLMKIQDCIHLNAGFRVLAEKGSKVNSERLTNSPGELLEYLGAVPPQVHTMNTVPEQFFRHAEDIIRRGFEQEGVSMMGATSRKPSGLDSGAALREFNDIESARFAIKSKAFERFIGVKLARLVVDEKRAIAERGEDEPVRAEMRRGRGVSIRKIKWEEASLDEESYAIRVFPSSALPSQPAGRIATVESWIGSGLIDRDQALQLLDFPDLEDFTSMQLAPHEIVLDAVERMIEDGEYIPPEPVQNLELSVTLVSNAYQRYRIDGAPEERTELLLRYMDDCEAMIEEAAMAQQAPPGVAPPGAPPELPPGEELPPEMDPMAGAMVA